MNTCATVHNREVLGSNPTDAVSNLGHVRLPHVAQVSRDDSSVSEKDGSRSQTEGGSRRRRLSHETLPNHQISMILREVRCEETMMVNVTTYHSLLCL